MPKEQRREIAANLSVDLGGCRSREAQAWAILTRPWKGMQDRSRNAAETIVKTTGNYDHILKHAAKAIGAKRPKDATCEQLEAAIFDKFAEQALKKMHTDEAESPDEKRLMKEMQKELRRRGFSAVGARFVVEAGKQGIKKAGFKSYIRAVKLAGAMNRKLGTKMIMSQVTRGLKFALRGVNVFLWVWLAWDVLNWFVGPSHRKNAIVILQLYLEDRLGDA